MDILDGVSVPRIDFNYIFTKMYVVLQHLTPSELAALWDKWLPVIVPISILFSLACIAGIVYASIRLGQVLTAKRLEINHAALEFRRKYGDVEEPDGTSNDLESARRWNTIQELIHSASENDWRAAIIEADSILERMVDKMGYAGESLGERLKKIEKSDFNTIESAWSAHKVRNRIAHDGSAFTLTKTEATRVISLYEQVFEEFFYI